MLYLHVQCIIIRYERKHAYILRLLAKFAIMHKYRGLCATRRRWSGDERRIRNFRSLPQRIGLGHVVMVSDTFRERLIFLSLPDSFAPSLSDCDESLSDFLARPMFLSSFSVPNDSRFDFRRWRCGGWHCDSIASRRYFRFASQNISCRWAISGYL